MTHPAPKDGPHTTSPEQTTPVLEDYVPFARRESTEDLAKAQERNLNWLIRYGLLRDGRSIEKFLTMDLTYFTALLYPSSTGDGFDISNDAVIWATFYDDFYDGPPGRTAATAAECAKEFLAITRRPPGRPSAVDHPLTNSFVDLWRREAEGMSTQWRERAAAGWCKWTLCFVNEAANRERGTYPTLETYLLQRIESMARGPFSDVIEGGQKFELPPGVLDSYAMKGIIDAYALSIGLVNDIFSAGIEDGFDNLHNAVLITQHHRGCSREEAIQEIARIDAEGMDRWQQLHATLPAVYNALDLTPAERGNVERYVRELGSVVRANFDWHTWTGRYRMESVESAARPTWMRDFPSTLPPASPPAPATPRPERASR